MNLSSLFFKYKAIASDSSLFLSKTCATTVGKTGARGITSRESALPPFPIPFPRPRDKLIEKLTCRFLSFEES